MAEDENMDAAQRQHFLVLGHQQLQRLEWLIQNLLKMARLEAGSIEFRREQVMLRDVAESAAAALDTMAIEAGVTVKLLEDHADAQFTGDGAWLAEAVIKILKNSIEHSKPGGTVDIALEQTPLTAAISIA
jgi:signal transduction histidine kinase